MAPKHHSSRVPGLRWLKALLVYMAGLNSFLFVFLACMDGFP